jgi:hypothetical protein
VGSGRYSACLQAISENSRTTKWRGSNSCVRKKRRNRIRNRINREKGSSKKKQIKKSEKCV